MRNILMLIVLLGAALFFTAENSIQAQQQTTPPPAAQPAPQPAPQPALQPAPQQEEELQPAEIETPAGVPADTDLILADVDEETAEEEDNLRNGRFIPTEEISQDLGVSFPVDI